MKLINVNDNPVRFNRDVYSAQIKESDPKQQLPFEINLNSLIEIDDPDLEQGSRVTAYHQMPTIDIRLNGLDSTSFRLVKLTPMVYRLEAIEKFDYELRSAFNFEITAYDGEFRSQAKIEINIIDVNDNRPLFERLEYSFRLDENAPLGTEVGYVHAIDLDQTPENNLTLYKITSFADMSVFGVNEKTGLIYVRDSTYLDRETTQSFNITVDAYNPGRQDLFDTARVFIYLNDLNDQTPRFDSSIYHVRKFYLQKRWIFQI